MDFASLMKSQISSAKSTNTADSERKYLKRSEIEAQRQTDYIRKQKEAEIARLDRVEKKRKRDEEEAEWKAVREEKKARLAAQSRQLKMEEERQEERERRKRLGLPELMEEIDGDAQGPLSLAAGEEDIDEDDLLAKLRQLGEPRRLFGETHIQRLRRYRDLTTVVVAPVLSKGPIPTTIALLPEADMKVPTSVPTAPEARQYLLRQLASYFDMLLTEWSYALSRRPQEVQESFAGKQAFNSYVAARENLRPLFKRLETDDLPDTLLAPVLEIVDLAQQKRYVHANDAYLRLSIGKAAWPIGVTMVGIHERSAREKLHEREKGGEKAHILADEVTRKMLQGIKRCLSFAQTRWPPEDIGQLMG